MAAMLRPCMFIRPACRTCLPCCPAGVPDAPAQRPPRRPRYPVCGGDVWTQAAVGSLGSFRGKARVWNRCRNLWTEAGNQRYGLGTAAPFQLHYRHNPCTLALHGQPGDRGKILRTPCRLAQQSRCGYRFVLQRLHVEGLSAAVCTMATCQRPTG